MDTAMPEPAGSALLAPHGVREGVERHSTLGASIRHDYGMIGFLKQLVDELHGPDIRAEKKQRYLPYRVPDVRPASGDDRQIAR
jgi:hypothetical protein